MKRLLFLMALTSLPSFGSVDANVSFATDYVWRGMTQSDGPAIQGGFDYASDGGFYAGIWGSNVNFNDGAGNELDYYFGYGFDKDQLSIDFGYISYDYPNNKAELDFKEIYIGLMMSDLGINFAFGQDGAPDYKELTYEIGKLEFSYGQYDDYGNNFGISYGFICGSFDCVFKYSDFSDEGYGADEEALILTISANL